MDLMTLNAGQLAVLGAVVAGATELITRLRGRDLWVAATIVTSAVIGGLVSMYYGLDFLTGIVAGLGTSGVITTVGSFGNKSAATPRGVVKDK